MPRSQLQRENIFLQSQRIACPPGGVKRESRRRLLPGEERVNTKARPRQTEMQPGEADGSVNGTDPYAGSVKKDTGCVLTSSTPPTASEAS